MQDKQRARMAEAFRDRLGGFVREALEDPTVIEVMVNGCGRVWLDTLGPWPDRDRYGDASGRRRGDHPIGGPSYRRHGE